MRLLILYTVLKKVYYIYMYNIADLNSVAISSSNKQTKEITMTTTINNRLGKGTGVRPHVWKSGPDATAHDSYRAWLQCRNQANYRTEGWCLTFDEWQAHWAGMWHRRGRTSQELCITRLDCSRPWSTDNVIIITRRQHAQRKTGTQTSQGQGPSDVVLDHTWAAKA